MWLNSPSLPPDRTVYPFSEHRSTTRGDLRDEPCRRPDHPLPSNTAEDALITRPDMEVAVRLLPPGGAGFLKALIDGGTLGAATATAFAETPSFDLPANITGMIEAGVFTTVHLGDQP
jgi:hypothetical protein